MPTRRSTSKQNKKAYLARIIALLSLAGTSNERFLLVGGISWSGHPRRENIAFGKLSNIAGQARHQQQFGRCSVGLDRDAEKWDIVYSLCGSSRKEELLRSLTSLAVLISAAEAADSSTILVYNVHLITDGSIDFRDFPPILLATVCFYLHEPTSRAAPLFAPCSTQRLYLHEHVDFDNVDQAIYLDMDTLWMDTPRKLREEFRRMLEGNALFAMALETTDMNANGSWYRRGNSRVLPYYGDFGLNAGVLLLNLKALRASGFSNERDKIIRHFLPKKALPLGDQDILNAYASKYPRQVHLMSCLFNFRSDSACYSGFPAILHGNRNLKDVMNSTYRSLFLMFGKLSHSLKYIE